MPTGTISDPIDIETAFRIAVPGDVFYLRAGTYEGDFILGMQGTEADPITYKAYNYEHAIIDGTVNATNTNYVRFWGIDINDSGYTDRSATRSTAITLGEGLSIINGFLRNHSQGVTGGTALNNYTLYGNLAYYNGWESDLGHAFYVQHAGVGGYATVANNAAFSNFGYGFHCYGTAALYNFIIDKNTNFHNGSPRESPQRNILLGGYSGTYDSEITDNRLYHKMLVAQNMLIGWGSGNTVEDVVITGNYSAQAQSAFLSVDLDYDSVTIEDNYFYGTFLENVTGVGQQDLSDDYPDNTLGAYNAWTDTYFLDLNAYDSLLAKLTVYNKSQSDNIEIDLTYTFGLVGTVYVHNVSDYWTDIQECTISEGIITINMEASNRSIETPVGCAAPDTTFPDFGCFILRLDAESVTPPVEVEGDPMNRLFDLTYSLASVLGGLRTGVASSGSTTYLIDTIRRKESDDYFNEGTVWILFDALGASAPPEGECAVVSDFVQSTGRLTFSALTTGVSLWDRYAVAPAYFPLDIMVEKINLALQAIEVVNEDTTSLATVSGQTEYSLPAAVLRGDLREVWIQTNDDANDNRWSELGKWDLKMAVTGAVDTLIIPPGYPSEKDLRLVYVKRHVPVWNVSSSINEAVHRDRVIFRAAEYCMVELMSENDSKPSLGTLANYYRDKADQADSKYAIALPKRHSNVNIIKAR